MLRLLMFSLPLSLVAAKQSWMDVEGKHVPHYKYRFQKPWKWSKIAYDYFYEANLKRKRPPGLTPDWKIEEMPPEARSVDFYGEFERPYRLQPMTVAASFWSSTPNNFDHPHLLGCYCCTAYKKSVPLSGCAVLTMRHILTTATSTELILKDHGNDQTLVNILGAYYNIDWYLSNDSYYMTPARIHYHPKYLMPDNVNASHPLPAQFDLAIWTAVHPFYKWDHRNTYVCNRAGSYWLQFGSPVLGAVKQPVAIIVGFQFIMWWKRVPTPFHKYAVKTQKYSGKCPKTEWGWFFCIWGRWALNGLDSGAALHRATQGQSWLYDGLLGLHAFATDLRAKELTHYFTPLENHVVLSWMYDAYMGRLDYRYLDYRFENSEWQSPKPKNGVKIEWQYKEHWPHIWDINFKPPIFYKK